MFAQVPPHISEYCPFRLQTCYSSHTLPKSSCPCPHISLLPHPYPCKTTPNHPRTLKMSKPSQSAMPYHISHTMNTQKSAPILTEAAFYLSRTLPTSTSPITIIHSVLSFPDFSDSQPSLPRSLSPIMSKHSGHSCCFIPISITDPIIYCHWNVCYFHLNLLSNHS